MGKDERGYIIANKSKLNNLTANGATKPGHYWF
jgi:hypothetical protein